MVEQVLNSSGPVNGTYAALAIANRCIHGLEDFDPSFDRLVKMRSSGGYLYAGELALEQAQHDSPEVIPDRFRQAGAMLVKAANGHDYEPYYKYAANRARALYRLAQLPVLKTLYANQQLPSRELVQTMYQLLARQGAFLVSELDSREDSHTRISTDLIGQLGEYSCLLLAQREALKTDKFNWIAMQSSLVEDHGGDLCSNTSERAHDIDFFQSTDESHLEISHQLEVRTSDRRRRRLPRPPIVTVQIHPHLSLHYGEQNIAKSVVVGADFEARHPDKSARITKDLDQRSAKLFRLITKYRPLA
jgi:hypothetical protein